MEVTFPLELPNFESLRRSFRHSRYRMYEKLPTTAALWLEERETNRLFARLVPAAKGAEEQRSLEHEHMWEISQIEEKRAFHVSDKIYAEAKRLYIPTPPITCKDDDANWERGRYVADRHFLTPAAVEVLRAKIRTETKARWEPVVRWSGWVAAIVAFASKYF